MLHLDKTCWQTSSRSVHQGVVARNPPCLPSMFVLVTTQEGDDTLDGAPLKFKFQYGKKSKGYKKDRYRRWDMARRHNDFRIVKRFHVIWQEKTPRYMKGTSTCVENDWSTRYATNSCCIFRSWLRVGLPEVEDDVLFLSTTMANAVVMLSYMTFCSMIDPSRDMPFQDLILWAQQLGYICLG